MEEVQSAERLASEMTKLPHPDGPAMLKEGHSQTNTLNIAAGAQPGWRNDGEHPLTLALARKAIDGAEWAAGECYRKFYEMKMTTGQTRPKLIVISGATYEFWTERQVNASNIVRAIEDELQKLDTDRSGWVLIVQKFCGEGYSMRESVRASGEKNPRFTKHRIKLALNKLSVAISKTKIDFRPSE